MTPPDGTGDDQRRACTPCRGTGQVISALGGEPRAVTCPWCGGSGEFVAGRDAQSGAEPVQESGQSPGAGD